MLTTFSCQAYANVIFFGDVGKQLLKLMGYQDKLSGSIPADSVDKVLERLQSAVSPKKEAPTANTGKDNPDAGFSDQAVSLRKRALPLIELLKAAAKEKCNVWWETK